MLFNSYPFVFVFLPVTLGAFFFFGLFSRTLAALWLFAASLFFYGWWDPTYVGLLLASILLNFTTGWTLTRERYGSPAHKKAFLVTGIAGNLALLAYFKYANFFLESANQVLGTDLHIGAIVLPLGISFFTFTQIAFLVDAYRGEVRERHFVHYCLFVTYFPHLIAGPVLHHKEMMPQFALSQTYRPQWENLAVGISVFAIGLLKKVILADGVAQFVSPVFSAASTGVPLTLIEAWCGALAYTLQLYFDFSGYSDMAIGLSLLFGIRLPLNFNSPYKSTNIIEFWRRWHVTLSRFLRDYLYLPLGGNRKGTARRYVNLLATMLLGGLWHGAGWTFVIWGGLHGAYLCVNNAWRAARLAVVGERAASRAEILSGALLTFLAVVFAWVFFRATDAASAWLIIRAMLGENGAVVPSNWFGAWYLHTGLSGLGVASRVGQPASAFDPTGTSLFWIACLLVITWIFPNTQQFMTRFTPALESVTSQYGRLAWVPSIPWAIGLGLLAAAALLSLSRASEFLYFQF
jgi:D-alanyl-lipoteichoic acid acyltransferase DltB (MBOAT superfamily)